MFGSTNFADFKPDPDDPDWHIIDFRDKTRFSSLIGTFRIRRDGGRAIVRLHARHQLTNAEEAIHGGALLAFLDIALFPAAAALGTRPPGGVTLDVSTHFITAADPRRPLDAVVELTRETRRMAFLRGALEQGDDIVLTFMAVIRKPSA